MADAQAGLRPKARRERALISLQMDLTALISLQRDLTDSDD